MARERSKGGCISGLIKLFVLGFAVLVIAALFVRDPDNGAVSNSTTPVTDSPPVSFPYEFLDTKQETDGHQNIMDLYAFDGPFDIPNLKAFCLQKKSQSKADWFYTLTIFDNKSNAGFPDTPFTAMYGSTIGNDTEYSKHIRAIYVYNKKNGYSKLSVYADNMWASKAEDYDL